MLPFVKLLNPAPIILTVATMCGILVHDVHVDQATAAIAAPALAATVLSVDALDKYVNGNFHTHVERPSIPRSFNTFRSSLPNAQPTRDDARRYMQNRKASLGFGDALGYVWPSV